jgi:hypothetical protein
MFMRLVLPILLSVASKQLKKNNQTRRTARGLGASRSRLRRR